ncbi:hypothetical protein DVH05_010020 [Phytophthora capsici]|nr:hypothetical protein DVH05_010020 [Phytophthora capsici]
MSTNYLFLGNPGTGKSTLINCLARNPVFKAGISYGGGLTSFFQKHEHDGKVYMDTPGLADRTLMKQAAEAITKALRQSGTYKIFFMVRLENGRVVADDLSTIETLISCINLEEVPFTIIINNVKERQFRAMMEKGDAFKKVATLVNAGKYITPSIVFIPTIKELDEEDNAIAPLPDHAAHFIQLEAKSVVIEADRVSDVKIAEYEQVLKELQKTLEKQQNDNEALRRRMGELEKKHGFCTLM